jgi:predicted nucleic acid-binding protein
VDLDDVATCLPIVQEVLQGFREEKAYRRARDAMLSFPIVESPLGSDVFLDAVGLYRAARRGGRTIRSSVDCLIAACAIRHDLEVLHRDRDFAVLSQVSALRERTP